ncbi:DUF1769-domain-containing protein [Delitschia confertaspora ATCC 74209]|uniref:DUF1769-domain-containing protein n=1 Tax=Delitschia confertaspora ATCC 74209 TaxID=1513339 RepID=A0A9P4JTY5_9PLEO|nr:DUF1769-domain-containing protein [Delitschia confertaspora ATCC 74209]
MASHEDYILKVTAGPTYDTTSHQDVHVNSEDPINISSEHLDAQIHVRIKDYRGLPEGSPSTSPYFSTPQHPYDRYSISFSFKPKSTIRGDHLVFGNDFDHPIRDRLPPLFDKAFSIVKWWIDPGLEGDVQSDEPWLYGALLSSLNIFKIGGKGGDVKEDKEAGEEVAVYEEGAEGDGEGIRKDKGIPSAASARQKHFLNEAKRKDFEFEQGRVYKCDFFNPYLDFNEFSLKLGYGLPAISIVSHWDGQPLRYVLKNKDTGKELFVIVFQLIPTNGEESAEQKFEEVHEEESSGKEGGGDNDDLD